MLVGDLCSSVECKKSLGHSLGVLDGVRHQSELLWSGVGGGS